MKMILYHDFVEIYAGDTFTHNEEEEKKKEEKPEDRPLVFTADRLKEIIDYVAVDDKTERAGRINVNTAPARVLRTLPGVSDELAERIVSRRQNGERPYDNVAELLDVSDMSEATFIALAELVTVRSYQFRVHSVAKIERLKAQKIVTAVLDRSGDTVQTLYWRER